jgi:membrane associated rhomboid family serine protease
VLLLLAVVFVTFSMQFFEATAAVPALLRLTPAVLGGAIWQLVTYPFVGAGGASIWFLLELLILFWFGRDVCSRLGRRRFWRLLLVTAVAAAAVAVLTHALMVLAGGVPAAPFITMQGHRMLITILVAAFATLYGEATILLFFVLPLKARWFLWLEVLAAFVFGLLPYKDLAGFLGVCAAVLLVYSSLGMGGPRRALHSSRKRLERWILERRLARLRRRRRFDVIDGGRDEIIH